MLFIHSRPHCKEEDDGVLCVTLLGAYSQSNVTLLILDARLRESSIRLKEV